VKKIAETKKLLRPKSQQLLAYICCAIISPCSPLVYIKQSPMFPFRKSLIVHPYAINKLTIPEIKSIINQFHHLLVRG
jgi:hypothetical protein